MIDFCLYTSGLIISTCNYVGGLFMFGDVDANSTQHCNPNGERSIGWECLPRGYLPIIKRCPTPLTNFDGCESGQFPKVHPFPICPNLKPKPSCLLATVR